MVTSSSTKRSPETTPATTTTNEGAVRRFVAVEQKLVQHSPGVAHNHKTDFSVLEVISLYYFITDSCVVWTSVRTGHNETEKAKRSRGDDKGVESDGELEGVSPPHLTWVWGPS